MTFEEEFPSLAKKIFSAKSINESLDLLIDPETYYFIPLQSVYVKCSDKQRILDVADKLQQYANEHYTDEDTIVDMWTLLKELGLTDGK